MRNVHPCDRHLGPTWVMWSRPTPDQPTCRCSYWHRTILVSASKHSPSPNANDGKYVRICSLEPPVVALGMPVKRRLTDKRPPSLNFSGGVGARGWSGVDGRLSAVLQSMGFWCNAREGRNFNPAFGPISPFHLTPSHAQTYPMMNHTGPPLFHYR